MPLALALLIGCQSCHPTEIPEVMEDTGEDTGDLPDPIDTGEPYVRCAVDELEPNGSLASALALTLEARACGRFQNPLDLDFWSFNLAADHWLSVEVGAQGIGSDARPVLLLSSAAGEEAAVDATWTQADPRLVFPAKAGGWTMLLSESTASGDETHYPYELLLSEVKEPVTWDLAEPEGANDSLEAAAPVTSGQRLFGGIQSRWDMDWYALRVPAGKHAVSVQIEAFSAGSAGDFTLSVFHGAAAESATVLAHVLTGAQGDEADPSAILSSMGGETLWVRVWEAHEQFGPATWYVFSATLEEE